MGTAPRSPTQLMNPRNQVGRRYQQTQHQEQAQLGQPGQPVVHLENHRHHPDMAVADHHAGQVDGQKAAAAHGVGGREHGNAGSRHEQRIQRGRQADPVGQLHHGEAAEDAGDGPDAELLHQHGQGGPPGVFTVIADQGNQHEGQENGHRVVAARLDFQGGAHPFVQVQAAPLQQREHRGGVGGGNDGAHQQGRQPVQVEHPPGHHGGTGGGQPHAQCGQDQRRLQANPEGFGPGSHAAVQQNDPQGQIGNQEGQLEIVELDAAGAVLAHDHPNHQEDQQNRHAHPARQRAQNDADDQHQGANQR